MEPVRPLPTISLLFRESWQAFTKSILNCFFLFIISLVLSLVLILSLSALLAVAGIGIGGISALSVSGPSVLTSIKLPLLLTLLIIFFLLFFAFFLISSAIGIATILVIAEYLEKPSPLKTIRRAIPLVIPSFLVQFLIGLIVFGGFLFPLPPILWAFLFNFLFLFAYYEVILNHKRGLTALKDSYRIISQNFGAVFLRIIVFIIFYLLIGVLIPGVFQDLAKVAIEKFFHVSLIFTLISSLITFFLGWFGSAYFVTLYKQARESTDFQKRVNLTWIKIISLIGWAVCLGAIVLIYSSARSGRLGTLNKMWQTALKEETAQPEDQSKILTYVPSSCGLSIPILKTTDTYQEKERKWLYEEVPLNPDFYVLDKDVFPVEKMLGAFIGYKEASSRLGGASFAVAFPGLNIYCVDNSKSFNLEEYKSLALANKNLKVSEEKKTWWGEVELVPVWVEGKHNDTQLKEPAYLGVSQDGKKLLYIRIWSAPEDDPLKETLGKDIDFIIDNLKYRQPMGLEEE